MINGAAIISGCMLFGFFIGNIIGSLVGIDSNVGGEGFAMIMLLLITDRMESRGRMNDNISGGIKFWQSMYIPIVVAMTATQNVVEALDSGLLVILAGVSVVAVGFVIVWASSLLPGHSSPSPGEKDTDEEGASVS